MEEERIPYKNACIEKGLEYYDYKNYVPEYGSFDNFEIHKPMGRGKYSEVYEGIDRRTDERVVIKILKPVRSSKILREISILEAVKDGENCIRLIEKCNIEKQNVKALIFEYVYPENFKEIAKNLSDNECRYYLYQLLKALDSCHSRGIIHRDVKHRNLVVNPKTRSLKLIDWGLSEYYRPGFEYNVRVASRPYKGPELLLGFKRYDYSLDIWSAGCTFGAMIFKINHVFMGKNNPDQLVRITKVLGTQKLFKYIKAYDMHIDKKEHEYLKPRKGTGWNSYITSENKFLAHEEALDLLEKMLTYDHALRPTAKEAMAHKYFDPVREG